MTWDQIFAFVLGFATATVLIVGVGFFWLKRRWKAMLFGMGAKLFSKGLRKVQNPQFREVGKQ